jgi:hypothetical protein
MSFRKHDHVGVQIKTKLGEVLSCIGKGCTANYGLPNVLQALPVQHRKEEIERSYATGRMRREKVEMALAHSAILDFFFHCNVRTYLLVSIKCQNDQPIQQGPLSSLLKNVELSCQLNSTCRIIKEAILIDTVDTRDKSKSCTIHWKY